MKRTTTAALRFCCLVLTAVLLSCAVSAIAHTPRRLIRVGFYQQSGYQTTDPSGVHSGYGFEYLQEIAIYANWDYIYIGGTWEQCLDMLREGKIDLVGGMIKTPEREREFAFASESSGTDVTRIVTRSENRDIAFEEFGALDGKSVAMLIGNAQNQSFLELCDEYGISVNIVNFRTPNEMHRKLLDGAVDAMLVSGPLKLDGVREIATLSTTPNYYVTSKNNTALLNELNYAMRSIHTQNPFFEMELYQKYFDGRQGASPAFTRAELAFIENNPVIKYVSDPNFTPISSIDANTGKYTGIAPEILELVSSVSGIRFEPVLARNFTEAVEMVADDRAQLLAEMTHDYNWARQNNVNQTCAYLRSQSVIVTSMYANDLDTLCLPRGYFVSSDILEVYPREKITYLPTPADCVEAVRQGAYEATYLNSYVASYLLANVRNNSLITKNTSESFSDICMAVSKDTDPLIISIINKSLNIIPSEQLNRIVDHSNRYAANVSVTDLIYINPLGTMFLLSLIFVVIFIVLFVIIRIKARANADMTKMLYYDDLTGYGNYKLFIKDGRPLVAARFASYAVLYLDVLNFKLVNDNFGFEMGDTLIKGISTCFEGFVEKNELFARVYADNFVALLRFESERHFKARLESLLSRLEALSFAAMGSFHISYRAGVYRFNSEALTLEQAADRANFARSLCQRDFKSHYNFYNPNARQRVLEEKSIESEMHQALGSGQFIPYYQPKVNIESGEIVGCEALVRWEHPRAGLLLPGDFIPLFEKNGFITQVDLFIFESVCRQLREWIDAGFKPVPVSCNFSRRHIRDSALPDRLHNISSQFDIPPSLLEMELTETVAVSNMQTAQALTQALKGYGFSTSIDDYGTGYSSISLMQQLPIDVLKLDKSFVESGMTGGKQGDIFRSIVDVAQRNGIMVICEGVEKKSQLEFLKSCNCKYVQGFLFARPMPASRFAELLRTGRIDIFDADSV